MPLYCIKNRFQKACVSCGASVAEAKGYAFKNPNWQTVCNSSACLKKVGLYLQLKHPVRVEDLGDTFGFFTPYCPDALPILRGLPKARWNGQFKCWTCSKDAKDRPRVIEAATKLKIPKLPAGFSKVKVFAGAKRAVTRAKEAGAYSFQLKGVEFLQMHDKALLADDMGLGKTFQSLLALDGEPTIVVCPASLKFNWAKEIAQWRPDYSVKVCMGKTAHRKTKPLHHLGFGVPKNKNEIYICNYEMLPRWLVKGSKETNWELPVPKSRNAKAMFNRLKKCVLIADEAHLCKSSKATRSKRISVVSRLTKKVWMLTGTPLVNRPPDLFGTLASFNMSFEVFGSWNSFVKAMNGTQNKYGKYEWGTPRQDVAEKMRRVMLRRLKDDVLDLPAKRWSDLVVEPSAALEKMMTEAFSVANKHHISNWAHLKMVLMSELGFATMGKMRVAMAEARIPAMIDHCQAYEEAGEPLVIFSAHRKPIDILKQRKGWEVITGSTPLEERQEIVDQFQSGELKGIGLTIGAGSTGLTLTAASTMIFVDLDWNPSNNSQCEDRICRIGQNKSCHYIRMTSEHPLDIALLELLSWKDDIVQAAIESEATMSEDFSWDAEVQIASPIITPESHKQLQKRLAKMAIKEKQDKIAQKRVIWLGRVPKTLPPVSKEIAAVLADAIVYMQGHCDGAIEKDNFGFNRPDAMTLGLIQSGQVLKGDKKLQRFVWHRLRSYRRQLASEFPTLFCKLDVDEKMLS